MAKKFKKKWVFDPDQIRMSLADFAEECGLTGSIAFDETTDPKTGQVRQSFVFDLSGKAIDIEYFQENFHEAFRP